MAPILGVILPTFNRAQTLPRALESVLSQQVESLQVIVVDDGSTDATGEYLATITDPRVTIVSQRNRGVCAARNTGVEATAAEFVTFLDSDDEARSGWAKQWLEFIERGVDFSTCGIARRSGEGDEVVEKPQRSGAAFGYLHLKMLAGAYCIRRSLLIDVGGFREGLQFSENTDLALRLGGQMLEQPFANAATDDALVTIHQSNRTLDTQVRFDSAVALLEHDRRHLERSPRLLSTYAAIAGVAASKLGRRKDALSYLRVAIRHQPMSYRNYARFGRALVGWPIEPTTTDPPAAPPA